MENSFLDSWAPSIVSTGVLITVISFFLKRFFESYDKKIESIEASLTETKDEIHEVRTNYNEKFREVNQRVDAAGHQTREHLDRRIDEIIRTETKYRIKNEREMGMIIEQLNQLNNRKP